MGQTTGRSRIRVLLCGTPTQHRPSLLVEITVREVLNSSVEPSFEIVHPVTASQDQTSLVPLDRLAAAVAETTPDIVLVLADEAAVDRASQTLSPWRDQVEIIGLTRGGHALFNLGPGDLRDLLRTAVAARRARLERNE